MSKELQVRDKMEIKTEGEQTRSGRVFVPAVDIYESEQGLTLLADMPGVDKEGLAIDLKDNNLTISGQYKKTPEEGLKILYQEYEEGNYFRQFTLAESIDQPRWIAQKMAYCLHNMGLIEIVGEGGWVVSVA